jgi:hypothetical protein
MRIAAAFECGLRKSVARGLKMRGSRRVLAKFQRAGKTRHGTQHFDGGRAHFGANAVPLDYGDGVLHEISSN